MSRPLVRPATADDLGAVEAIYDHQVRTAVTTFDLEPPGRDYWRAKRDSTTPGHHVLVADDDGEVVGFAYAGDYRPRAGYAHTRETSVYLAEGAGGRGLGRALYDDLLQRLRADGIHTVLAVVAQPNPASEALHRSCGFERVGLLPEVGRKHDRWIDVAFWALRLEPL